MSPLEEYTRRLRDRESRVSRQQNIHVWLGNIRLAVAALTVFLLWISLHRRLLSLWWLAVPVVFFIAIAAYHSRILRARDLAERAVTFYKNGLARAADQWSELGETGERFNDPHHVYAGDLDLFGEASLFQLLSTARTRIGEERLAQWLLKPAPLVTVRERQRAVTELGGELDLREDLAVLGEDAGVGVYPEALLAWAEAPNQLAASWMHWLPRLLCASAIVSTVAWGYWDLLTPLIVIVAMEGVVQYRLRPALESVLGGTEHAFHDLDLLSAVLARIEKHEFRSPSLQELQRELRSSSLAASQAIAGLRGLVDLINSRDNLILRVLDVPLMYSVQVALAAERWRQRHGAGMKRWLNVVGEIEALLSLASYSFEHPDDPFPEFDEDGASFQAQGLGHPLLRTATCIRNDVSVGASSRVLLVSGSNMSGKSTLLRAVGINVVLAMAGAPARAARLRLSPLQVGASIRINDSLREGSSRFYAEIKRLRQIFDLAQAEPSLLFLLDEVLQGTNSRDRRIGAEGVVRALVARGAIGMVSTHDLSLTEIGISLEGRLRNVHFQDEIVADRMQFDYKLRDGVVTKSNGLELMRIIGLEV